MMSWRGLQVQRMWDGVSTAPHRLHAEVADQPFLYERSPHGNTPPRSWSIRANLNQTLAGAMTVTAVTGTESGNLFVCHDHRQFSNWKTGRAQCQAHWQAGLGHRCQSQ
eukprot:2768392-Rhodomonas_salina.1